MSIASIHLVAQQARPLQPYCSGNIAGGRQECQSSVFLPTCSCFGWELCFPGWQPGRKSQQQQLRRPAQSSPSGGKEHCLWLSVALHIHAHGFSYTLVSTTLLFLDTRRPSVSHRWCLEPPVSLWWHRSALAHCWALDEQVG